jgi:hypothetical protein
LLLEVERQLLCLLTYFTDFACELNTEILVKWILEVILSIGNHGSSWLLLSGLDLPPAPGALMPLGHFLLDNGGDRPRLIRLEAT